MGEQVSKSFVSSLETSLLVFAAACCLYLVSIALRAQSAQRAADRITLQSQQPPRTGALASVIVKDQATSSAPADVMGRLSIPKLNLSVPIMSDYQTRSLLQGVGHIPGSAMPGGLGTMGLAGHRDTYFRALRGIKPDMDIQVGDESGTYHYSVDSTEIVTPDAIRVLDIQSRPELTLITCYPFNYIGPAPKRFIVHAHLISALPDE